MLFNPYNLIIGSILTLVITIEMVALVSLFFLSCLNHELDA